MSLKIEYDNTNSIIFDDTLDLLLNRSYDYGNDTTGSNYNSDDSSDDSNNDGTDSNDKSNDCNSDSINFNNHKNNQGCIISRRVNASKYNKYEYMKSSRIENECDKNCEYYNEEYCTATTHWFTGGLILPKQKNNYSGEYTEGSGNTIIVGDYGTGKSTLAFQMAAACANEINEGIAIYYALESTYEQTIDNFVMNGKEEYVKQFYYLPDKDVKNDISPYTLYKRLKEVLKGDKDEVKSQVLMPRLSPKGLNRSAGSSESFFTKRYKELENMLNAISYYNEEEEKEEITDKDGKIQIQNKKKVKIKLVVIDSLTVFGDKPLLREEIYRLFDLFKQNNVLGVFTIENCEEVDIVGTNYVDSIKFRADVVISLSKSYYNNYYQTYFEIEKSRNIQQVYGKHPYKIRQNSNKANKASEKNIINEKIKVRIERKKLDIYPSLHYILSGKEDPIKEDLEDKQKADSAENESKEKANLFGIKEMSKILPDFFDHGRAKIITITGNSGLFKSDLALNFLMNGLDDGDNCLIIRLNDREFFETDGLKFNNAVYEKMKKSFSSTGQYKTEEGNSFVYLVKTDISDNELTNYKYKYSMNKWEYPPGKGELYEIVFKNGLLLPEEFVNVICNIINQERIKRIAFIDLKTIGVSYPFLVNSENAGGLFLPTFIHLMRNYGVHVVISSSPSEIEESDQEVKKAIALSDAVIRIEMKENSNIYITGIGNMVTREEYLIQLLPKEQATFILKERMMKNGELSEEEIANHSYTMFEIVKKTI